MRTYVNSIPIKRAAVSLVLLLATALLAACGDLTLESALPDARSDAATRHAYVASIAVAADDTADAIEARYDASVVSWHPEAGFAVLGSDRPLPGLARQGKPQKNQNAINLPEATAYGVSAWAGGVSAWAGGVSAWAGGVSAWAGASSDFNPFPGSEVAWGQVNLAAAQQAAPNMGAGVTVAVIDSGVDLDHPALQGKLAPQSQWKDFVDGDNWPDEVAGGNGYGHGTAVAGVILQAAPNATILPLRALGTDGSGDITQVIQAIDHAVAMGADVINLSLGTNESTDALENVLVAATAQGVLVVASAGNGGDTQISYPAEFASGNSRILGLGSVDAADIKSDFSSYGVTLSMVAPGESITTLYPDSATVSASGTSFAAPLVAGSLALALGEPLRVAAGDLTSRLKSMADGSIYDPNSAKLASKLGKGRLDVAAFIADVVAP